jgi:DNA-binding SARP family transcriptional activator/TolB-like protein
VYTARFFGGATVEGPDGPLAGRIAQRRQLALVAVLSRHIDRPVARDRLLALLWPEAPAERARRALADGVYLIRRALGESSVISLGDDLLLVRDQVASDVASFRDRLAVGDDEGAVSLYAGPFLDGFHFPDSTDFEDWLQREREAFAREHVAALERLASRHEAAGDPHGAAQWWRRAADAEPHNTATAVRYVRALADAGDRAGALRCADLHRELLRQEYGLEPDPALNTFIERLRSGSSTLPFDARAKGPSQGEPAQLQPVRVASGAGRARYITPDRAAAVLLAVAVLFLTALAYRWRAPAADDIAADALDADAVVVLPFRTAGAAADLEYFSHGLVELLSVRLNGVGTPRAVDPGLILRAAGVGSDSASAVEMARRHRAGGALVGSVVGTAASLTISASLVDARTGRTTATATVQGREEDLHGMLDKLLAEMLARQAGEEEHRLDHLTSTSPSAQRTFLQARAAHRRGDYAEALRQYSQALEHDSTFALAALGVTQVSGWVGGSAAIDARASRLARQHIDRLSDRDRIGLIGRIAPRDPAQMPSLIERLTATEEALRRWPDHPRLWYRRGDYLMHFGRGLDIPSWQQRARESFQRAMELDPTFAEPVHHLLVILAESGDSTALRALAVEQLRLNPGGPVADHLRWWAAYALNPPLNEPPSLDGMDTDATLRWIGIVAQDYGFAVDDGDRAVRLRLDRPGVADQHLERRRGAFAWALNRGRYAEAIALLQSIREVQSDPAYHLRLAVLAALYADGDRDVAAKAARDIGAQLLGRRGEMNRCVVAQWQIAAGVFEAVITSLADTDSLRAYREICMAVARAQHASANGAPHADDAINELEALLAVGRYAGLVDSGETEYAHLALARLHEAAGRVDAALRAVRRRSFYNGWQPYLATMLREEARLAAAAGDTAGAARALRHYRAFRPDVERRDH